MEYIKNKNFTWERSSKVSDIPLRELDLLCKQYDIKSPHIKIIISETIIKEKKKKEKIQI